MPQSIPELLVGGWFGPAAAFAGIDELAHARQQGGRGRRGREGLRAGFPRQREFFVAPVCRRTGRPRRAGGFIGRRGRGRILHDDLNHERRFDRGCPRRSGIGRCQWRPDGAHEEPKDYQGNHDADEQEQADFARAATVLWRQVNDCVGQSGAHGTRPIRFGASTLENKDCD